MTETCEKGILKVRKKAISDEEADSMRKNLLTMDVILAKEIKYILEKEGFCPGDRLPSERYLAENPSLVVNTIFL